MSIIETKRVFQIITTLLSLILIVILPLIVFLQIGAIIKLYTLNTEFIMSAILITGILATLTRYFIYQYPQNPKKRTLFNLLNSIMLIIYFSCFSILSSFKTSNQSTLIAINFQSVFFFLALPWIVFMIRDIYNLVDYSLHEEDYITFTRKQRFELKYFVKCSRCGFRVKIGLRHCPRCHNPL